MSADRTIIDSVQSRLDVANAPDWDTILSEILAAFDCITGTIHQLDPTSGLLQLVAQRGIPEAILSRVERIPIGKGMAGLAAERREPVQVCNLQTDESGQAKPAAKMTEMAGSVAAPMIVDGELVGTIGIARPDAFEFSQAQIDTLLKLGELIGGHLKKLV